MEIVLLRVSIKILVRRARRSSVVCLLGHFPAIFAPYRKTPMSLLRLREMVCVRCNTSPDNTRTGGDAC